MIRALGKKPASILLPALMAASCLAQAQDGSDTPSARNRSGVSHAENTATQEAETTDGTEQENIRIIVHENLQEMPRACPDSGQILIKDPVSEAPEDGSLEEDKLDETGKLQKNHPG